MVVLGTHSDILQHSHCVFVQIRVVNAFRSSLESGHLLHVSKLPTLQETPRPGRYHGNQIIEGKVTSV